MTNYERITQNEKTLAEFIYCLQEGRILILIKTIKFHMMKLPPLEED